MTKKILLSALLVMSSFTSVAEQAPANSQASIPLDAFTMMPVIRSVSVSDDGTKVAILRATTKNGDYVIDIRDTRDLNKKPVTLGAAKMMVSSVTWLNNDKIGVSFRQILESNGYRRWVNQFAITDADGKGKWLMPTKSKKIAGFSLISKFQSSEDEILAQTDVNRNRIPDVIRYNVRTGKSVTIMRGNTKVNQGFEADYDGEIRVASGWNTSDDTIDLFARKKGDDEWQLVHQNSPKNRGNFEFAGFSKEHPNKIYIVASNNQDKSGIYLYDLETKELSERMFGLKSVDVGGVLYNKNQDVTGYHYTSKAFTRYFTDPAEQALYESLVPLFPNKEIDVISRSDNDDALVVRTSSNLDSGSYYLITDKKKLDKLGERLPLLTEDNLAKVKYISYTARDGRKIKAYVTIPKGKKPFPVVVMPHGGPWVRDAVVFDEWSQLLASQGYLVIQPNYRGSTGYGLDHWIAGDFNWGLTMQDDLDDAALFLVKKGLATKDKLAMFGWSYGGYAAFAGSMRENNIYQCTVAGAGVSDLNRINATLNDNIYLRELQRPTIKGVSPLAQVEKVNVPILVIHGDIDGRVPVKHSRQFVEKLEDLNKDHKYVELEDADHFSDTLFPEHKNIFYSELINWLDNKCGLKG
ncbi:MAG: alpha/beta hydrolase family protein [Colwellia sp.]